MSLTPGSYDLTPGTYTFTVAGTPPDPPDPPEPPADGSLVLRCPFTADFNDSASALAGMAMAYNNQASYLPVLTGTAARFGGFGSAVRFTPTAALNDTFKGGGTFVTCALIRSTGPGDQGNLINKADNFAGGAIHYGWMVRMLPGNRLRFIHAFEAQMRRDDTVSAVPMNTPFQLAITYDSTVGTNAAQFYVNGVQVPSQIGTTDIGGPSPGIGQPVYGNDKNLNIGNYNNLQCGYDGDFWNLRLYRGVNLAPSDLVALGPCA